MYSRGCKFPPPTRYTVNGVDDYHYSTNGPLLEVTDDTEFDEQMAELRSAPQARLSRPSIAHPRESQDPLIHDNDSEASPGSRGCSGDLEREEQSDELTSGNE